ncbi:MAG: VOC family protein [Limimaricola sp.]|uniref:VOC family protein n=1 Tax=Limimaricola sp. TaxID=2211665 RepID=UPI001DADA2FF|nr:VOC family protein [Limimaricola sp.]MBI1416353.1 VOC family protein [Limimaricola sp.]
MSGPAAQFGGLFFRAKDPDALVAWYAEHLGVPSFGPWPQEAGIATFAPFRADDDYWPADRSFMLNLRVVDLDALISRLCASGIAVETRDEWDSGDYGRFARVTDPEGNPVELWQPPT